MPTNAVHAHLTGLYAQADDPWDTHASGYEQAKFRQTTASLPRERYRCGLEVGCGAGALTAHLAPRCDHLIAMDCTARALTVAQARLAFAHVDFVQGAAPSDWPTQTPDLVILSEVLYFLTDAESAGLAVRLTADCAPACDIVLVNWLGDTGGAIGGADAADRLIRKLTTACQPVTAQSFDGFRIDVLRRQISPRRNQG